MSMEPLTHEQLQLAFLEGKKIIAQCPTNRYLASLEIEVAQVYEDRVHLRHPFGSGTTIVPANAKYIRYYIYSETVMNNVKNKDSWEIK